MSKNQALIVGGGVIGVCCAYFLSKAGMATTIVDRGKMGEGASYGNAGLVAAGHQPLNKPSRIRQSLKLLLDPRSPLYIPLQWNPGLVRWLWYLHRNSTESGLTASMDALAPLGHITLSLFDLLVAEENLDCNYVRQGYYEICRTEKGLKSAELDATMMQDYGYNPHTITGEELRDIEPAILDEVIGGVYFPESATCDPHRFVTELADRIIGYGGTVLVNQDVIEILSNRSGVKGVRLANGEVLRANTVVLATGAYSHKLTQKFGLSLPVQAGKGYHRDLANKGEEKSFNVPCLLGESHVFCTPLDKFTRLAGTLEFSGVNHKIRHERLDQLNKAANQYLEGAGDGTPTSEWCGLRPCTPDGMPFVGPVPGQDGLFVATGHATLGLTLGPVTGKIITEQVLEGRTSLPAEPLGIERIC